MATDILEIFGDEFTGVTGIKATDDNDQTLTYIRPQGTKSISANGTGIDVAEYASVDVSVPTGTARTSADLTASGATVTVPAGLYAEAASKAVASGSASTPATTITANPSISVDSSGLITATASATQSVTPAVSAGYVSSGTAGTVTVSGSNTSQLTTQAAQTIHPSTSDQTISSGKYLTGTQTIKAVTHNLTAGIIKSGEVVKIGDSTDDDCVTSITGTYSGGGSGYTLLGSGTYVKQTGTASIEIPVSYTGTPKEYFYYNTTPPANTQQTIMGYNRVLDNSDLANYLPNGNLICAHRTRNASNSYLWTASTQVITLTSTTMSCNRPGAGVTHVAGTWKWFIYGEAAT